MKVEDAHMVKLVNDGTLGKIEISRYSLSTYSLSKKEERLVMEEVLTFILACHQDAPKRIYASSNSEHSIYLVTIQFVQQSLCNLMLDFSRPSEGYRKLVELSGAIGMYQYDSLQPASFHSTYLNPVRYKAESIVDAPEDAITEKLLQAIIESSEKKRKIELTEDIV